jgi:hypothetical protein
MIPRHQTILFIVLLASSALMAVVLWQLRERAHQRLLSGQDSSPAVAPAVAPAEPATLLVAHDDDGSLLTQLQSLPLPQDPGGRARAILGKLLDLYAAPGSAHPVPGGASSIAQVFLLPAQTSATTGNNAASLPAQSAPATSGRKAHGPPAPALPPDGPQLAVVNLTGAFVASHPSGLETESLTVLSICGTLHANLPRVTQVRFLVDGQTRANLAGHADLTRTYLATDAVPTEGAHP